MQGNEINDDEGLKGVRNSYGPVHPINTVKGTVTTKSINRNS